MSSYGAEYPEIMVIGEAPGAEEDNAGKPFVGRSGLLLRQVLEETGIDIEKDVRFTNVVRCRPPDNKITKPAILACRQFAIADIQEYKPDIVFLMGNTPLSAILGESGISNWNGTKAIKKVDGVDAEITFYPLYHPAYILRDMSHMNEWVEAIFNAIEGEEEPLHKIAIILPKTTDDLFDMQSYLSRYDELVFDFETTSLDAYSEISQIIAVSFAAGDRSYAYPLYHKEASEWWEDNDRYDAIQYSSDVTIRMLEKHSGKLIGHNVKFDKMWAQAIFNIDVDASGDTMLISHMLDSRAGIHGLKRLAGVYCGMYEYERELSLYIRAHKEANPQRGGNYGNIPLSILLPYAAGDGKATLILNEILIAKLSEKQIHLYNELIMPASNALARMQSNGFAIDKFIAYRYFHIYSHLQALAREEINNDKKVKKIVRDKNAELEAINRLKKKYRKPAEYSFNPNSSQQLGKLYFEHYKIPVLAVSKKTGLPSTSGKTYRPLEDTYPILHKVRVYKMYLKAISTYLRPAMDGTWLSDDGFVHSTFNQHATVTSRLSCSDPVNLQNIPTPEKEPGTVLEYLPIKNIFTHRDWWNWFGNDVDPAEIYNDIYDTGALVAADQSGMELRVFASLANCEPMLAIHRSGLDFHSMVAIMSLEHKYPDQIDPEYVKWFKKNKNEVRYRYKWTNWTLLYGGDVWTLHNLYGVPLNEAEETIHMYYSLFPEVLEYKQWTQEFAEDNGYIESPFGRREYLPHINDRSNEGLQNRARRAAVNMPVQSAASDTVVAALIVLDILMRKHQYAAKLVSTVHDSIVVDSPRGEIVNIVGLMTDVMENIAVHSKIYMPNIDFSWLRCPLRADAEIGTHYGVHMDAKEWIEKYDKLEIKQ